VLQRALGLATPVYRHHLLLLEESGDKLAKLHGAVGWRELAGRYTPEALCGFLARVAGLAASVAPASPRDLLAGFAWDRVRASDAVLRWDGAALSLAPAAPERT
jgi:glutamyl/glutaminyl-tRNA synthetase